MATSGSISLVPGAERLWNDHSRLSNTTGDIGESLQMASQSHAPAEDPTVSPSGESRLPDMTQMDEQNNVSGNSGSLHFGTNELATHFSSQNSSTAPASNSASQLQPAEIETDGESSDAHNRRLRNILNQSDNRICADCGAPDPRWAVAVCTEAWVLSVAMDEWTMEEIDAMAEVGGNSAANAVYEAYIPEGYSKPGPDATLEERQKFIKSKYEAREFFKKGLQISSPTFKSIFSTKFMDSFRLRPPVTVLRGANLAVRDMMTSDPYVVLTLGQQTIQTGVVPSSLNPIWNEDVMLSVPRNYGPLKLVSSSYIWNEDVRLIRSTRTMQEVYDHDMLSADDIMGEAQIDIQPLISAGMAYPNPETYGNMQIGKWSKTEDNALITDSNINIVDGKVKQYVQLKLQNVECGEMYLDVEWLPLEF
ncbi:hypothetical protein V6N13_130323 [Hibiscus sabdariffa]